MAHVNQIDRTLKALARWVRRVGDVLNGIFRGFQKVNTRNGCLLKVAGCAALGVRFDHAELHAVEQQRAGRTRLDRYFQLLQPTVATSDEPDTPAFTPWSAVTVYSQAALPAHLRPICSLQFAQTAAELAPMTFPLHPGGFGVRIASPWSIAVCLRVNE